MLVLFASLLHNGGYGRGHERALTPTICILYYALTWVTKCLSLNLFLLIWCQTYLLLDATFPVCRVWLNKEAQEPEWRWVLNNVSGRACGRETAGLRAISSFRKKWTSSREHRGLTFTDPLCLEVSFDWYGASLVSSVNPPYLIYKNNLVLNMR